MNIKHIFVYGTLRRGHVNHYLLADMGASYVGDFTTAKAYCMIGLRSLEYNICTIEVCINYCFNLLRLVF